MNEETGHTGDATPDTALPSADPSRNPAANAGVPADPWHELKAFTAARIAPGSTGVSLPVREVLQFRLAHAHARDAVFSQIDEQKIRAALFSFSLPFLFLRSSARDRSEYLQRPDLGRRPDAASLEIVRDNAGPSVDIVIVIADGLSAEAVNAHAGALIALLLPGFQARGWRPGPVCIVREGRVAVGDEIGEILRARLLLVLIGERPGLSAPDSLGVYLTYSPRRGLTDESRNCVSNIRPEGLPYAAAAEKILYLAAESLRSQSSGVMLKDLSGGLPDPER